MQNYSGEEGLQYHVQIRPGDMLFCREILSAVPRLQHILMMPS